MYWGSKEQIGIWSSTTEVPPLATLSTSGEWSDTGRTSVLGFGIIIYVLEARFGFSSAPSNFQAWLVAVWFERSFENVRYYMTSDSFHRMFFNKRYAQASIAFLRAGQNRVAAICNAYLLRERARSTSTSASEARIKAFLTAADAFVACTQNTLPEQINERLAYCRTAGECYSETGSLKEIGDRYRLAERYAAAACIYREGGCFDQLVEVIAQHGDVIGGGFLEDLKTATQMHYLKVCFNERHISEYLSPP